MSDDDAAAAPSGSLNPFSDAFDASAALRASPEDVQVALPTPRDRAIFGDAGPLNNLSACASLATAPFRLLTAAPVRQPHPSPAQESSSERKKSSFAATVGSASIAPRHGVLAAIHRRQAEKSGPLSMLERAVRLRCRMRVVVRETHAIRGDVTGCVVAFDKHFNLVLMQAVIRDKGQPTRRSKHLFVRGENVVLVALE